MVFVNKNLWFWYQKFLVFKRNIYYFRMIVAVITHIYLLVSRIINFYCAETLNHNSNKFSLTCQYVNKHYMYIRLDSRFCMTLLGGRLFIK